MTSSSDQIQPALTLSRWWSTSGPPQFYFIQIIFTVNFYHTVTLLQRLPTWSNICLHKSMTFSDWITPFRMNKNYSRCSTRIQFTWQSLWQNGIAAHVVEAEQCQTLRTILISATGAFLSCKWQSVRVWILASEIVTEKFNHWARWWCY